MTSADGNAARPLAGRKVLVSGAASGMGAACAELASSLGAEVYALDRDEERLTALAERLGVHHRACDLTQVEQLPSLVQDAARELGGLDGLVNAAGIWHGCDLLEITPEDFDRVFAINVRGLFFLLQAAARVMADQGSGSIVNIASAAARFPRPWSSHYAASKSAVVSLTTAAARALGPRGVRVNAVAPGDIDTPMLRRLWEVRAQAVGSTAEAVGAEFLQGNPLGRAGTSEEVAAVVMFLLGDASSYVNGETLGITGGID